jgi:pimeloyl-ACP methyl ester carboxylesterase
MIGKNWLRGGTVSPRVKRTAFILAALVLALIIGQVASTAEPLSDKSLAEQIFETIVQLPGNAPGHRIIHAKGIVCQGTFTPTRGAASSSHAKHLSGPAVPITVRFSDADPSPSVSDILPNAAPSGMPIRFSLKGGDETDIVSFQLAAKDFAQLSQNKLTFPVLVLGGEKANGTVLGQQLKLVASNVTVVLLKDTGHWVLEERPKETTYALVKFL